MVPLLVAELADRCVDRAVTVRVEQAARLVILLGLLALVPAKARIDRQVGGEVVLDARLEHVRGKPQEVAVLVVVPAAVGEEIAGVVGRHPAQPVAAEILVVARRLQQDPAAIERDGEAAVEYLRGAVGIAARLGHGFEEQPGPPRDPVGQTALELGRGAIAPFRADHHAGLGRPLGLRRLGDVVEQAAGRAGAVEHAGRPLEEFHPLDIEQLRHGETVIGVAAQPVEEDFLLAETAGRDAGIAEHADAGKIAVEVLGVAGALVLDEALVDHLHGLGREQGFDRQLAGGNLADAVEGARPAGDDDDILVVGIGPGRLPGLDGQGRRGGQQGQATGQGGRGQETSHARRASNYN